MKSLASKVKSLASKPQPLETYPVLGSRTALFLETMIFYWKTPETSRKICEDPFLFSSIEDRLKKIFFEDRLRKKFFEDLFF